MALQALGEYGSRFHTSSLNANVTVDLVRTVNRTRVVGPKVTTLSTDSSSRLELTSHKLPRVRTLAVSASGTGCLRFQVSIL